MKYPQYIVLRYGREVFRSSSWNLSHAWAGHDKTVWGEDAVKVITRSKPTKAALINSLDDFTKHYIIAALWSSNAESNPSGGEPLDRNYSIEDLTVTALLRCISDCKKFQAENSRALSLANYREGYYADGESYNKMELAGHDFWFTRNRHGVGFWDRGLRLCLGDILSKAATEFKEVNLYVQKGKVSIDG